MRTTIKNTEHVQQSGSQEIKDLVTLVTLPNDGDAVHIHAEVRGRIVFDIYPGMTCFVFEALVYRDGGYVNVNGGNGPLLNADTSGFANVYMTSDGDDVKLQMNFNHPTIEGVADLDIEWTMKPIPG
jgi:hypothetical protein